MTPELPRRGRAWLTSPLASLPSFFRNVMDRMSRLFDELFGGAFCFINPEDQNQYPALW